MLEQSGIPLFLHKWLCLDVGFNFYANGYVFLYNISPFVSITFLYQ